MAAVYYVYLYTLEYIILLHSVPLEIRLEWRGGEGGGTAHCPAQRSRCPLTQPREWLPSRSPAQPLQIRKHTAVYLLD
jgi:hypothetical protein